MKRYGIIILLSLCSILTACQKNNTSTINKRPSEDEIVSSGKGEALLMAFTTTEEVINASDAIVYGEIVDYKTGAKNGSIYTAETIHVIDSIFGDIEAGTDITLIENGGWVLIRDYIDSFVREETGQAVRNNLFKNRTDDELDTKYFEMIPDGYYYPDAANREVLLLCKAKNGDNYYVATCGWMSVYREGSDGMFNVPSTNSSLSDPEKTYNSGTITYEELKEQILETVGKLQEN